MFGGGEIVSDVKVLFFDDDGVIPNHPSLPVLLYEHALIDRKDKIETIFHNHNWKNSWVNGIYDFHHYHSNAHEVLGIIKGCARLQLGGPKGENIVVHAGDVIVLPAGTGHKRLQSTADFQVVGAYPGGISYNLKTGNSAEYAEAVEQIENVPLPKTDPVYGEDGPLLSLWSKE
ncbi:cupin domain-containing protein [Priestia flexa]|uniref:cupin domain-containing protein n=1 Tax=Priestia flexa TaxID=86664 RepID=UPI001B338A9F|nr:cupin domain-containing protein [Priestia flexa]